MSNYYPSVPCPYCNMDYTAKGKYPGDAYMFEGHIIMDCTAPDPLHKAFLNASPIEIERNWPDWAAGKIKDEQ